MSTHNKYHRCMFDRHQTRQMKWWKTLDIGVNARATAMSRIPIKSIV